jgi:hypothetical protein
MTTGIAFNLENTVILAADGRERKYDLPGQPIVREDSNKIIQVGPPIGIISAGISKVSEEAIAHFQYNYNYELPLEKIIDLAVFSLSAAWQRLGPAIPPHIALDDPNLNGTLLIGGFASDTQFIASVARHYDGRTPRTVSTNPGVFLAACADQNAVGDFFDSKLTQELNGLNHPRTLEDEIQVGVKCAALTIRLIVDTRVGRVTRGRGILCPIGNRRFLSHSPRDDLRLGKMEQQDIFTGGVIRYAIIKRGESFSTVVYPQQFSES